MSDNGYLLDDQRPRSTSLDYFVQAFVDQCHHEFSDIERRGAADLIENEEFISAAKRAFGGDFRVIGRNIICFTGMSKSQTLDEGNFIQRLNDLKFVGSELDIRGYDVYMYGKYEKLAGGPPGFHIAKNLGELITMTQYYKTTFITIDDSENTLEVIRMTINDLSEGQKIIAVPDVKIVKKLFLEMI